MYEKYRLSFNLRKLTDFSKEKEQKKEEQKKARMRNEVIMFLLDFGRKYNMDLIAFPYHRKGQEDSFVANLSSYDGKVFEVEVKRNFFGRWYLSSYKEDPEDAS